MAFMLIGNFEFCYSGAGSKVIVSFPAQARLEDIETLFSSCGQVLVVEKLSSRDPNTQTVLITYDTQEQAQQ